MKRIGLVMFMIPFVAFFGYVAWLHPWQAAMAIGGAAYLGGSTFLILYGAYREDLRKVNDN